MINHLCLSWFLLFCLGPTYFSAWAQVSISGRVTSAGVPIGSVRVDLRQDEASRFLVYTFTDGEGKYRLTTNHAGKLTLHFKALSYEPLAKEIELGQKDTIVDVGLIAGGLEQLQEVVVNAKHPYQLGRDTIELKAQSFLQGDERTVEDLLKKIPGLNVGPDGSIKIGQKEVEKVMIEGDDFFEKGYRLLTQNMSVQPLDKIQVIQRYANNKHLKGIENSDKVALNLQLKEDSKSQWLGSASLSGTSTEPVFYYGSVSLMNFGKKNKYYLLGTANNNGVDAVSSINHLLYSGQVDEPGQIGVGIKTPTLIDYTPDLPGFDYRRTNFNQDRLLSFNAILNPSKKLKVKWLGFLNPTKKSFYRNTVQDYHIKDIQFTNTENYEFNKHIDNYFTKWELQYDIHSRSTLSYIGNFGSLRRQDIGNLLFNGTSTVEMTKMQGYLTNHNVTHTYKLSDREALVSAVRWIRQKSPLDYNIDQYYYEDLFQVEGITNVYQHAENNLQYLGVTSHYLRKQKNGDFMELAFANEYKEQELITDFLLQAENGAGIRPPDFSNHVSFGTNNAYIMAKYTLKRRKWEWTPQLRTTLAHTRLSSFGTLRNRTNLLISPRLLTKWTVHRKGKLETELLFQQNNTDLVEVMPNYYTTGIRNFVKGLDDITTLNSSSAVLTYIHGNMLDKFFANLSMGYNRFFDYISNQTVLNTNFNLAEQLVLKDKKTTFLKALLNYYVKPLNGNLKLEIGADFADYETSISGVGKRKIHSSSHDYGLSFRSVWKYWLNVHMGSRMQLSSFRSESTNRLTNTYSFLNVFFKINDAALATLKNEAYHFGSFVSKDANMYYFSDFSFSYNAKKIKTRFTITAQNLFNNRHFKNAMVTDTYRSVTEYRLLPRYIAFGLDYSF